MTLSRRLMLTLAGAALAPAVARAAGSGAPAPAQPPASVGVALPLTGGAALIGDEIWRGVQLAAAAAATLPLVPADMPEPARAAPAINGLIRDNHASVLLGCGTSGLNYPASAAAELAQVPLIELTAPADGIVRRGFRSLLRTGPSTTMAAALIMQTLAARYPNGRVGLLFDLGATAGALAAALIAAGLNPTLSIGYPEDVADLRDQVGRLMRAKVDVLVHAGGLDGALGFALAAQEQGWRPGGLIGYGEGYTYRETHDALGEALEGVVVVGAPGWVSAPPALAAAYTAQFGVKPRAPDSLTAYAGARLVFETLAAVGGDGSKLLAALRGLNKPRGSLANGFGAAFDASGQNTGAFVILQEWRAAGLVPAA